MEQALLTQFQEFFRTGYLAWGYNISNPEPPFFHLTEQGRKTLAQLSRDPGNPAGYLRRIDAIDSINPISRSYLEEALRCYVADLYKAGAVMIGGAAESLIIELRRGIRQAYRQRSITFERSQGLASLQNIEGAESRFRPTEAAVRSISQLRILLAGVHATNSRCS